MNQENITIPEALSWWQSNKKWVWPAVVGLAGLLGGNLDRVGDLAPSVTPVTVERVQTIETRLDAVEKRLDGLMVGESNPPQIIRKYQ